MSENHQLTETIERYLNGEMTKAERADFEKRRLEDAALNDKVTEQKQFINLIKQYGERLELERRLDAIHGDIDVYALEEELTIHPGWIVRMWRNHHSKISVAASIAIFAVLCTLFATGYLNNKEQNFAQLRGEIKRTKDQVVRLNNQINSINPQRRAVVNPGNFRGTGFAVSANGYIATDNHVIAGADSVYVQSNDGKSYKTKVVFTEPASDIAILEITDPSFKALPALPYSFKKGESDLGENVFTLGYPKDNIVLGSGILTSSTGYKGDTTQYQMSALVDYGHSGAPLLDSKGNVIGIVNAREKRVDGAAFAIKTNYLLKALKNIPADSLNRPLNINSKNTLATLPRVQQIKKIENYVFMVRVYNQ